VQIADAAQRSAAMQSQEARRSLLPSLAMDTGYVRNMAGKDHRDTWLVGLTLSVPLSPTLSRQAQSQMLKAEAARWQREATESEVKRQLATLRASYDAATAEAHAMETEVAYREQVSTVEHEMQRLGNQTLENTFRHERDLLDARYRLSQAKARAAIAWSAAQTLAGAPVDAYIARLDPK
jgi:outer membrane protein TolC